MQHIALQLMVRHDNEHFTHEYTRIARSSCDNSDDDDESFNKYLIIFALVLTEKGKIVQLLSNIWMVAAQNL